MTKQIEEMRNNIYISKTRTRRISFGPELKEKRNSHNSQVKTNNIKTKSLSAQEEYMKYEEEEEGAPN